MLWFPPISWHQIGDSIKHLYSFFIERPFMNFKVNTHKLFVQNIQQSRKICPWPRNAYGVQLKIKTYYEISIEDQVGSWSRHTWESCKRWISNYIYIFGIRIIVIDLHQSLWKQFSLQNQLKDIKINQNRLIVDLIS